MTRSLEAPLLVNFKSAFEKWQHLSAYTADLIWEEREFWVMVPVTLVDTVGNGVQKAMTATLFALPTAYGTDHRGFCCVWHTECMCVQRWDLNFGCVYFVCTWVCVNLHICDSCSDAKNHPVNFEPERVTLWRPVCLLPPSPHYKLSERSNWANRAGQILL